MDIKERLSIFFNNQIHFEEIRNNLFRVYSPFFHEDGDMYSIYIEVNGDNLRIMDLGNTLMRVSYTFNLDTNHRQKILNDMVISNNACIDSGLIYIDTNYERLPSDFLNYTQVISKVSSMDILQSDTIRSLFYEDLNLYMFENFKEYELESNVLPTDEQDLIVDYLIPSKRPLFIFGVKDDAKASKVVITCLNFQKINLPYSSLIIHDDMECLTKFHQSQITNAADKQFYRFIDFKSNGKQYIDRELAS